MTPITEKVKTYEDACALLNRQPVDISNHTPGAAAFTKLETIAEALNEGWTPNWDNSNERKWYPWFRMYNGFGFNDATYSWTRSCSSVGSRLCFKSEELADYTGRQFESIYKELMVK